MLTRLAEDKVVVEVDLRVAVLGLVGLLADRVEV